MASPPSPGSVISTADIAPIGCETPVRPATMPFCASGISSAITAAIGANIMLIPIWMQATANNRLTGSAATSNRP